MKSHTLKVTSHEGVETIVPVDAIRSVKALSDVDKDKARKNLSAKGVTIDPERLSARIEFADKSSKLVRESIEALRAQGVGFVDLGDGRLTPAINIMSAQAFTEGDAAKLNDLKGTFRAKVQTRSAGILLAAEAPQTVMDRRARALGLGDAPSGTSPT